MNQKYSFGEQAILDHISAPTHHSVSHHANVVKPNEPMMLAPTQSTFGEVLESTGRILEHGTVSYTLSIVLVLKMTFRRHIIILLTVRADTCYHRPPNYSQAHASCSHT
jgi:flagellar biosynthesis/type III secretory pathway ATPase